MNEDRHDNGNRTPSIAVIGSGPGGMSTAMLLARAGADVTVYESQSVVGGRTRRTTLGEFAFDTGPTFFMMPLLTNGCCRAFSKSRFNVSIDLTVSS